MNACMSLAIALLCATQSEPTTLSVPEGAARAFGGRTVERRVRVEAEGNYQLEWRTRILRGVVKHGSQEVTAPAEVAIHLKLPDVRARVELVHEVTLMREGKIAAGESFPLALFPSDVLSQFAGAQSVLPPVGLCDPANTVAPILKEAGLDFTLLQRNVQVGILESKVVLVAPEQPLGLAEPAGGIRMLLENGGTVVFLERSSLPEWFFENEEPTRVTEGDCTAAEPLVGPQHPILRDILPGDLSNWAGTGRVAGHALTWPDWPQYRPLLVSSGPAERLPLAAEYWSENGRVIVCELDVGRTLKDEPIAQILLCNLISYVRETPLPPPLRATRLAVPEEAVAGGKFRTERFIPDPTGKDIEEAAALLILVLSQEEVTPAPGFDLPAFLKHHGQVIIQSSFEDEIVQAVNQLVRSTWRDDPRAPLPAFLTRELPAEWDPEVDYESRVAWGILPEDIVTGLKDTEDPVCLDVAKQVNGWRALAKPGFLVKFEREGSQLVLCAVPPRADADDKAQARLVAQLIGNLTLAKGGTNQ